MEETLDGWIPVSLGYWSSFYLWYLITASHKELLEGKRKKTKGKRMQNGKGKVNAVLRGNRLKNTCSRMELTL